MFWSRASVPNGLRIILARNPIIRRITIFGVTRKNLLSLFLAVFIFAITFLVYKAVYPNPRNWYDHYLYLARAFMQGRVNLTDLPSFYQDTITIGNKVYVPFPPAPAVVLIPFITLNKFTTQQEVSVLLGSFDAVLVFYLLMKFIDRKKAFILTIFFSFGTAFFWASVVGTTWYFAHVVALLFLVCSLIFHFDKKDVLSGIFFSLAVLSRYPILLGAIFFALQLWKDKKRFLKFFAAAASLAPAHFIYAYLRFQSFFRTGYVEVYESYLHTNYPYTILQAINPKYPLFGYLDLRNIPLHLFTFLIEPPIVTQTLNVYPSPYGMGIIFTTPLLFLALRLPFKQGMERNLFIGALAISIIDFLHYMQGWVQFGYRFVLDFLPFLLIILSLRFKMTKAQMLLIVISILVTSWGVNFAINAGW